MYRQKCIPTILHILRFRIIVLLAIYRHNTILSIA